MSAAGIKAGKAYVEISSKDSTASGLAAVRKRLVGFGGWMKGIGEKIAALGAAGSASLLGLAKVAAAAGDHMDKMSIRTGVSVESLSSLGFAAERGGAHLEAVETSLRKMSRVIDEASQGGGAATDALKRLGLTLADLDGLSPDQQMAKIADGLLGIENPAQKASLAMDIFGKSGTKLLPMLAGGAKGLQEAAERAAKLGLVMTTAEATGGAQLTDGMGELWEQVRMLGVAIGGKLTPLLLDLISRAQPVLATTIEWVRANGKLIESAFKIAGAVAAAGASIAGIGAVIAGVANPLGLLVVGIGGVLTAYGLLNAETLTVESVLTAAWEGVQAALMTALDVIVNVAAAGVVAFNRFGEVVGLLPTIIETALLGGYAAWAGVMGKIGETLITWAVWLGDNWYSAIETVFANILKLVNNTGESVSGIWAKVWQAMLNPASVFSTDFAAELAKLTAGIAPIAVKAVDILANPEVAFDDALKRLQEKLGPLADEQQALAAEFKKGLLGAMDVKMPGADGAARRLQLPTPEDVNQQMARVDVSSTSSAAAIRAGALGSDTIQDRIAKAADETNRRLGRIENKLDNLDPGFGD